MNGTAGRRGGWHRHHSAHAGGGIRKSDVASVASNEFARDRQAQPRAAFVASPRVVQARKAVKDPLAILLWYAVSIVRDHDLDQRLLGWV